MRAHDLWRVVLVCAIASSAPVKAAERSVVFVNDVEALYAAINPPASTGTLIVIGPGDFLLTEREPTGPLRPNGGRLVLRAGTSLQGHNEYVDFNGDGVWDPLDADGDGTPDTNTRGLVFVVPGTETFIHAANDLKGGAVIQGGFDTTVERVTVRSNVAAAGAIRMDLLPPGGDMHVVVRNCLVEEGFAGIWARHFAVDGRRSTVLIEGNIVRGQATTFGFGIWVQNNTATNSSWNAVIVNNRSYGNRAGLFLEGIASNDIAMKVTSVHNVYENNRVGMMVTPARDGVASATSYVDGTYRSEYTLHSVGDRIAGNDSELPIGPPIVDRRGGGLYAPAGYSTVSSAIGPVPVRLSSNSDLTMQFVGTTWTKNYQFGEPSDLAVYGSLALLGGCPGNDDTARVTLVQNQFDEGGGGLTVLDELRVHAPPKPCPVSSGNSATLERRP